MRVTHGHRAAAGGGDCALTIGNFDGVHLGHQAMLGRLRELARPHALPTCVVTFEPHPREFFAPDRAPTRLTSLREKLERLAQCGIDRVHVYRFNFDLAQVSPQAFVAHMLVGSLGAKIILVGDDFRFGARRAGDFSLLKALEPELAITAEAFAAVNVDGSRVSSTAVRAALAAGDLQRAAQLLGRPYSISGRVVAGQRLGRALGFPTANVQMKHNRPALAGIFAVELYADGKVLQAVASLGTRPTVTREPVPVLEVHVLDYAGDLYGQHVQVNFLHKFRDEEKYADIDTLKQQIARDVAHTRAFFAQRRAPRQASGE